MQLGAQAGINNATRILTPGCAVLHHQALQSTKEGLGLDRVAELSQASESAACSAAHSPPQRAGGLFFGDDDSLGGRLSPTQHGHYF